MRWAPLIPLFALTLVLRAQSPEGVSAAPRNALAAGYRHIDSTGTNIGFTLDGGFLAYSRQLMPLLGVATEFSQTRTTNVGGPGGSFTLLTAGTGPRVGVTIARTEIFVQSLFGIARGSENYAGQQATGATTVSSHMWQSGGGLNVRVSPHFSLRAIDVEELLTSFAETTGTSQRHLTLGTGLVWRFDTHMPQRTEYSPPELTEIWFTCGTDTPVVTAGETIKILGHAGTEPDLIALDFRWRIKEDFIAGNSREVQLDTTHIAPGKYRVYGIASLKSSPQTQKDCAFNLQVVPGAG